jgi:glutamate:GABA antiporter
MTECTVARPRLRRELGRLDAVLLLIAAVVVIDTLGAVSAGGAQAFTWLAVTALLFFLPAGLVISELGSAFPYEGGVYVWARLAFGRLAGAMTAFLYWVETPIWLGGSLTITAVTVFGEFFAPLAGVRRYLFALGFIWIAIAVAVAPISRGKRVPASGAITQAALLLLFLVTMGVYAVKNGVNGFELGELSPTWGVFIAVAPVLLYNFVGFEAPSAAGGELRNPQRDVPAAVARAGVCTFVLYCLPILAILVVLPADQITSLGGFIDAIKSVFTVYGGHVSPDGTASLAGAGRVLGCVAAAGFIWVLLTNGLTWIMAAGRSQAVACLDGAGPRRLGRFSTKHGTPVAVSIVSGVVATVFMALAFAVSGGNGQAYFAVVLTMSIALVGLSNLAVFPAVVKLRYSCAATPRPFRIPGGTAGVWICGALTTLWMLLATAAILWPGLGTASPDEALPPGFEGRRLAFTLTELVPLGVLVAIGALFCVIGRRSRPTPARARMEGAVDVGY